MNEVNGALMSNLGIKQGLHIPYHLNPPECQKEMSQTVTNRLRKIAGQYPK